jgi:hypothetical protein
MFLPSCSGRQFARIESEMQAANIFTVVLAVALWAMPSMTLAASAAGGAKRDLIMGEGRVATLPHLLAQTSTDRVPTLAGVHEAVGSFLERTRALIEAGYERAPAFVTILSALLLLPVVALASFLVQRSARRKSERMAMDAMARKAGDMQWSGEMSIGRSIPVRQHEAWLTVGEDGGEMLRLAGHVTRIGRNPDNDIRLPDASVHRYHALIERTPDDAFVITDLSGKDGNGVRINGERLERAHLVDGDVIELGRTRLKFESVPI